MDYCYIYEFGPKYLIAYTHAMVPYGALSYVQSVYEKTEKISSGNLIQGPTFRTGDRAVTHHKYEGYPVLAKPKGLEKGRYYTKDLVETNLLNFGQFGAFGPGLNMRFETAGSSNSVYNRRVAKGIIQCVPIGWHAYAFTYSFAYSAKFSEDNSNAKEFYINNSCYVLYLSRVSNTTLKWNYSSYSAGVFGDKAIKLDVTNYTDLWDFDIDSFIAADLATIRGKYKTAPVCSSNATVTSSWSKMSFKDNTTVGIIEAGGFPPPPTYDELGTIALRAIQNLDYVDINTIAYFRDLKSFANEIDALRKLISNPANPKSWANLFLGLEYGSRLTVADTQELFQGINHAARGFRKATKRRWRLCRARDVTTKVVDGQSIRRTINYKVYVRPSDSGLMKAIDKIAAWDLFPSTANVWDLIPYSFVVDWFVDIGSFLEAIDGVNRSMTVDVIGVCYSYKDEKLDSKSLTISGARQTRYKRSWSDTLHLPPLELSGSTGFLSNIPQLLAIIIQRK